MWNKNKNKIFTTKTIHFFCLAVPAGKKKPGRLSPPGLLSGYNIVAYPVFKSWRYPRFRC
jgi:hypothetical protein